MSIWIPRMESYYNEGVPQNIVQALGAEYEEFSAPSAVQYQDPFPRNEVNYDVFSDSLYIIPRLQNYADPLKEYYQWVVAQKEETKP